ncbi:hypothetical protein GR160_10555 [Flavobacterium sp. Sd200]|uniref:GH32 C-terminal domain-containing protein n=1 Tax=Flavobacterium sp. Sd200 TaxID=2692211 RepID=UPI001368F3BC|nr:GH32 C-terminal domain-containing protein [Flavobacterium sp. Sd200]MXN91666.1 hypothetical protein [Flavobacterium sp. Sd200]
MKNVYLLLLGAATLGCSSSKDAAKPPVASDPNVVLMFDFNEESGQSVKESKTGTALSIDPSLGSAERIAGVEGQALRVNGYYGWATGAPAASYPAKGICISGWIAPSAFPLHRKDADPITENTNASIFSNINPTNSTGIALGINHHGRIIGQFKVGAAILQILSDEYVTLKEWNFIALNVDALQGTAKLYLNGVEVETISFVPGDLQYSPASPVFIGKESKVKTDATFDTNGLTGAIDAVVVWARTLTTTELQAQYAAASPSTPDLKIPIEQRFASDFHRPKYHAMPTAAWTNEPHGLIYLDGKYHIFSQRNFNGPYWGHLNWGHFVSDDLVSWEEKTQVLWPTPGFDEVGVWSGHAVERNGIPYIFYTGVNKTKAAIGLATGDAPYDTWTKNTNAIISQAPTTMANADFRDPFVFQNGNDWYMMVGTGLRNGVSRGGLFLYKSTSEDFTQWSQQGTMLEGTPGSDGSGDFWEMPVYYNFGSKSILLVNKLPNANALYWTGTFNGSQFVRDNVTPQRLDVINSLLSPAIHTDADGNLTAIGIIADGVSTAKQKEQGWAHTFSLPRVWTLVNDKIVQVPHPNLLSLRGASQSFSNLSFGTAAPNAFNGATGSQYEIVASLQKGSATKVGFSLHNGAATGEKTLIYYDYNTSSFVVDRSNSSLLSGVPKSNQASAYALPPGDTINWRIFVDASVIEVFVNEELAFATRVFPSEGSNGIDLYAQGGTAGASSVTIYNVEGTGVVSASRMANEKKTIDINVFPNPSEHEFNLRFEDLAGGAFVNAYVVSNTGVPIKKIEGFLNPAHNIITWDGTAEGGVDPLPGLYLIVGYINSEMFSIKVIKK